MQEILNVFEKEFDLRANSIRPYRAGFVVGTNKGGKYLKRCNTSEKRIEFVNAAKEYLFDKKFCNIDRFILTREHKPFFYYEDYLYTLNDYIEGRECEFDNEEDVILATKTLAKMHQAAKGFKYNTDGLTNHGIGLMTECFQKRLNEIKKLKKYAEREKKKFDYIFIENYDYFYKLGEKSLENLYMSKYNKIVEKTIEQGMLCHEDYSYQNIVFRNEEIFVTNFESCNIEIKVYDIVNLLRRKLRKCNWDLKEAKLILDTYRDIEPLSIDELYLMKIMLQFPQKLWRVVNRYYNSKRSWMQKSYIQRLLEVIEEKETHYKFIKDYDSIL